MDHLTFVLSRGSELYHGTTTEGSIDLHDKPTWFGDFHAARTYGDRVHKLVVDARDLRLLDVSRPAFHADFVGRVNMLFTGSKASGMDPRKERALAPLGLPDLETQLLVVPPMTDGLYERPGADDVRGNALFDKIQRFVGYFGRHHRYSLAAEDNNLDKDMVQAMILAYPTHDGYTCPIMWPSCHHGGFLLPETCLFDPSSSGLVLVPDVAQSPVGGGRTKRRVQAPAMRGGGESGRGFVVPPMVEYRDPYYGDIMVTACAGMFNS